MSTTEAEEKGWQASSVGFAVAALALGMAPVPLGLALAPAGADAASASAPGVSVPGWFFGAVWTVIYPAMGVAAWRLWRRRLVPGVLEALSSLAVASVALLAFMPVASAAHDLRVTTMMDVLGLLSAWGSAYAVRRVDVRAAQWLAPLLVWMPLTTALKVWTLARP